MSTNFTLRDFFVFLLTGLTLIISIGIIFIHDVFESTVTFFDKYSFIKDFSFLVTIFIIPIIYLIGHIIGYLSYFFLKSYVWIDKKFKKHGKKIPSWQYSILMKIQQLFYRQRVIYAILQCTKSDKPNKPFENENEFWICCAKLQIEKNYTPAEYWYVLNELFNSLNLVFGISALLSFLTGHLLLGLVYLLLRCFAFRRARQYAEHFVSTVFRLTVASQSTQSG